MIHPSHESPVVAEDSLNLGGMFELELRMQVAAVLDRPPTIDAFVYCSTVRPELAPGLHFPEEEVCRVVPLHRRAVHDLERELARSCLLRHDQRLAFEVRLVHLHDTLKNMGFLGQMSAKEVEPPAYAPLRDMRERRRLSHRYRTRPAPQDHPELGERNAHVRKPRV